MIDSLIFVHPWVPMVVWAVFYLIDYYLALIIVKLSRTQAFFCFETDTGRASAVQAVQRDIRQLKAISPTRLCLLVIGAGVLWWSGDIFPPYGLEIVAGAFLVNELSVFAQALRGILIYQRLLTANPGVTGQITYTIEFQHWQRFIELMIFAPLALLTAMVTGSLLLFGGGLALSFSSMLSYFSARLRRQPGSAPPEAGAHPAG
jgi:hypothetical protein